MSGLPICDALPYTGAPVLLMLILGAALLVVGVLLTVAASGRRRRRAALVIALLIGAGFGADSTGPDQAVAAEPPCGSAQPANGVTIEPAHNPAPTPANRHDDQPQSPLDIGQISTNIGIAPGAAPTPITGRIANRGPEALYVEAITVEISAVTKADDAVNGACDKTDYDLHDPVMPVDATLAPGDSAVFSGASIGFHNKPVNQDACQAAVVALLFRSD